MIHHILHILLKVLLWVTVTVVSVLIIVPVLLYIPGVQDFARRIATEKVSESTGMDISVGHLRLRFPLRLEVNDVQVIEASGDTMVTASELKADVKFWPLLKGDIVVKAVELDSVSYGMGNRDSLMMLRARVARASLNSSSINLSRGDILIGQAAVDGADVYLRILPDTAAVEKPDTAASKPMVIKAGDISLTNVTYRMEMLPTIDSLGCTISLAELKDGVVDITNHRIHGKSLTVDSVAAAYILPPAGSDVTAVQKADTIKSSSSEMWTITAGKLKLTGKEATYAVRGVTPLPGLDMNYIQASGIVIEVDSFYNRGTSITVPVTHLEATERCGLSLMATGVFEMDSSAMRVKNFKIDTRHSSLSLNAEMGMGDLASAADLPLMLNATGLLGPADLGDAFPAMGLLVKDLNPLSMDVDIDGTSSAIDINEISLDMPGVLRLLATGEVNYPMNIDKIGGRVDITGSTGALTPRFSSVLGIDKSVHIPAMGIKGVIDYNPGSVDGDMAVTSGSGKVSLSGKWNQGPERYSASLDINDFPVAAFMPSMGLTSLSASANVTGKGYNPLSATMKADADVTLKEAMYHGERYSDIRLRAAIADSHASGSLVSHNPGLEVDADFTANMKNDTVDFTFNGDVSHLDLRQLHLSPTMNAGSLTLKSDGQYGVRSGYINATASVMNLAWSLPTGDVTAPQVRMNLLSADSLLEADINTGDLNAKLYSRSPLTEFISKLTDASALAMRQIDARSVNVDSISRALPFVDLILTMGNRNPVSSYLVQSSNIAFQNLTAGVHNDSLLSLNAYLTGLQTPSMNLDTVRFDAIQHGPYLAYTASVNNRPGTMDEFAHVAVNGFLASNRFSLYLKQSNIKDAKGFLIGLGAQFDDSTVMVKFVPYNPTIAYKQWTLNSDNYVSYNFVNHRLGANLSLENDKSFLKLYTSSNQNNPDSAAYDDVVVELSKIRLQDWLSISPFAPPIKGDLSANLRLNYDTQRLTGKGTVGLQDLYYGRDRVGTFDLDLNLVNTPDGAVNADIALMVDSVKTITARGAINDSTAASPFLLDFSMIRFPLKVVNPFLPPQMAKLSGMLNGNMEITGDAANPVFNGYLDFDSTSVKVGMLGTTFRFSEEKIPVDSNLVIFDNFTIEGCNKNPLTVNGEVNLRHLSDINIDLSLKANDFQVVNSTRPRGADVYGKAFLDIDATAKGDLQMLNVNAVVDILAGTNVTYVMPDASSAITSKSNEDMVKFVQFNDTAQMIKADSIVNEAMTLNLDALLKIQEGSVISVDLSSDGKNRAQVEAQGDLDYSMTGLNGQRLTGRININKGYVRYSMPPVLSEKLFDFEEGSFVAFNGNVMNPILNVRAVDRVRANVTQQGQNSRLVYFDVGLKVTGTLETMNVAFDLSTDDDITVENELTAMSPEQRANQAMNLLLYNVYSGGSTRATSNLSGNALYSFLTSQINSWAANNIKGVDLSFGIDQYDKTYEGNTSTTTSYSYRVSKSLFNDRVKIIVGGNYSTDADADQNLSQNLINDISIEYMINRTGSMYVRIFRHTGYESILEGEVTQTGVGFVYRKKLNSLRDLLGRKPKPETDNK